MFIEAPQPTFNTLIESASPKQGRPKTILTAALIDTKLGQMIAISDERDLYLLEFIEGRGVKREIEQLQVKTTAQIISGSTDPICSITRELQSYFDGTSTTFQTPFQCLGTPFQKRVWEALQQIPYGETRSYATQAQTIGQASAYRAVANANGANQLAILIPCHRIINSNGKLGGYGGGISKKQWLIDHEKNMAA